MRKTLSLLLLLVSVALTAPARAAVIDPGTVEGTFTVDGKEIALTHAYAHLHDDAEGLIGRKQLRILLTDREVPQKALAGISFLPVEDMAIQGKVQGLLMTMAPNNPNEIRAVPLLKPAERGASLTNWSLSASGKKLFKEWKLAPTRVVGAIDHEDKTEHSFITGPRVSWSLRFSAPVFNEPAITDDLRGKAAQASPQVKALRLAADAMARGDFATLKKLSSDRSNRQMEVGLSMQGPQAKTFVKQMGAEMKKTLPKIQRVIVRGDHAVAILSKNEWATLVREGGQWKTD
jgi:hypothetical protein